MTILLYLYQPNTALYILKSLCHQVILDHLPYVQLDSKSYQSFHGEAVS